MQGSCQSVPCFHVHVFLYPTLSLNDSFPGLVPKVSSSPPNKGDGNRDPRDLQQKAQLSCDRCTFPILFVCLSLLLISLIYIVFQLFLASPYHASVRSVQILL